MSPSTSQSAVPSSINSKLSAFGDMMNKRWRRMIGKHEGGSLWLNLPPELREMVVTHMTSYQDSITKSPTAGGCDVPGCVPKDVFDSQREFMKFASSNRGDVLEFINADGKPKTPGHLIVHDWAAFFKSLESAGGKSRRSADQSRGVLSLSWVRRISFITNREVGQDNIFRPAMTKQDFFDKVHRKIGGILSSSHYRSDDIIKLMLTMPNLENVAVLSPDHFHNHISEAQIARYRSEYRKHSRDDKRWTQSIPDPFYSLYAFSIENIASHCVRSEDHPILLPDDLHRGNTLTHHVAILTDASWNFKRNTGPLTWHVELSQKYHSDIETAENRQSSLRRLAGRFQAGTGGPESLTIYLPHLRCFTTEAQHRQYYGTCHANMIEIMTRNGAATVTAGGTSRIKLDCVHNAPECKTCLGRNERYSQPDEDWMEQDSAS